MKIYDFDGMFDEKLADYFKKNQSRYSDDEWEEVIPRLYEKFGNSHLKSIGTSPRGFFAKMSDNELVKALVLYIKKGVTICRFLPDEIERRGIGALLLPLLDADEEQAACAVRLLGDYPAAAEKYLKIVTNSDNDDLVNDCIEHLKNNADAIKESALECYNRGERPRYMLEILANCVLPDDRVFEALINAFRTSDSSAEYASYLAIYGDERALPYIKERAEEQGLPYSDYLELRYAAETLGGSVAERDYTGDSEYERVQANQADCVDLFKDIKKD